MANETKFARDIRGYPIPVLTPAADGNWKRAISSSAVSIGPFNVKTQCIWVMSTQDQWVRIGANGVTATNPGASQTNGADIFLPAFSPREFKLAFEQALPGVGGEDTTLYLSAIRDASDGTIYVQELE